MKKAILGGLLGGLVLFVWGSISHMALPLGQVGVRVIPPSLEPALLAAMKGAMSEQAADRRGAESLAGEVCGGAGNFAYWSTTRTSWAGSRRLTASSSTVGLG